MLSPSHPPECLTVFDDFSPLEGLASLSPHGGPRVNRAIRNGRPPRGTWRLEAADVWQAPARGRTWRNGAARGRMWPHITWAMWHVAPAPPASGRHVPHPRAHCGPRLASWRQVFC
jgi:hypothetical protein